MIRYLIAALAAVLLGAVALVILSGSESDPQADPVQEDPPSAEGAG
jgi:hypothetical protein